MARSKTAEDAKLEIETGQSLVAMAAMTDSGDRTNFTSSKTLWSNRKGYEPNVKPNGVATGGAITPGTANDTVDVAALTCYLAGVKTTVAASAAESVTRGVTNGYRINSITITSAGAVAVVAGTESTAFSETRGAAGGPPYIPTTSVEVGQVRMTSTTAGVVLASEIYQVINQHKEKYDYPVWNEDNLEGEITFSEALPAIHTGDVAKGVYVEFYEPSMTEVDLVSDFTAPETSHSANSKQVYQSTVASVSSTLGTGGFSAQLKNGVTDQVVTLKNEFLTFRFYPDKFLGDLIKGQGKLGISRSFPANDNIAVSCTITPETAWKEVVA